MKTRLPFSRIIHVNYKRMRERIDGERERLQQLAARNPAVRREEIDLKR